MLTARQKSILKFVTQTVRKTGQAPSYREIGRRFRIASTNGVRDHLLALERKGYLNVVGRRRGIELAPRTREGVFSVPLVGMVPAGGPVVSDENVEELLSLPDYFGREGELFALRVRGHPLHQSAAQAEGLPQSAIALASVEYDRSDFSLSAPAET